MDWKTLEDKVRAISSVMWLADARPDHVDGVNFDCVIRAANGDVILIEVTKERDLDKVRADINKIMPIRMSLLAKGIICRGYIVIESEPTSSMIEMGRSCNITVVSISSFERMFFDYKSYVHLRSMHEFGSAVNQETGRNDETPYIRVAYQNKKTLIETDIDHIAKNLCQGARVVLTGDFGTGKSRCVKELFRKLSDSAMNGLGAYVLAVNLREHWGARSAGEIITGHLEAIGMSVSVDNAIRLISAGYLILLLDGFDEVGAQTFGRLGERRKAMRMDALRGVRDIVTKCKAGVLVAGRSYYFDSDEELLDAFGINENLSGLQVECASEFSQIEAESYLKTRGISAKIPEWLPKKPLVFQIVSVLPEREADKLFDHAMGEYIFWRVFSHAICLREAKIHGSLDANAIYDILVELGRKTRLSGSDVGVLTTKDLSLAYELVVGESPDDSGNLMLMRLCTLGRMSWSNGFGHLDRG